MAKKELYGKLAEQYYVENNMPISGIAKKLSITEKTLHEWKREGEWDKKRSTFLHSCYSCYSSLYELVTLMANDAINQYKTEGTLPEAKQLYFLKDMVVKLPKMKSFENNLVEEEIAKNTEDKKSDFNNNAEIVKKIFNAMTE